MTAVLLPNGKQQYLTTAGAPAVGYKVATFDAGTSNPRTTWQDSGKVSANTNPVILDARGEASIFWEGAYKVQLQDSTGAVIWTQDNLQSQPNGFTSTLVPATSNTTDLGSIVASWRSGYFATNVFVGTNAYPVLDVVSGNLGYYARTQPEITFGAAPVAFSYPPGHVYRYGTNTTPGTTDMTAAINLAANVCRQGGYTLLIPTFEVLLVSASLNFTNLNVQGLGSPFGGAGCIQATSAQFDIITITQVGGFAQYTITNLSVDGANPSRTPGLSGDIVSIKKTAPDHPYVLTLMNCNFTNAKKRCIYIERGGYTSFFHVHCVNAGLHVLECFGLNADQCTTIRDYGSSQFSGAPNGYGIKLTECVSCSFHDSIVEDTFGIQINGTNNRALTFDGVYQENFAIANPTGFFINDGTTGPVVLSSGIGLRMQGCFAGNLSMPFFTNWQEVYFGGNSNLQESAVPLPNRILQNFSGQIINAVAGAQSVTICTLALPPGTWDIDATLQTSNQGGANLQDLGFNVTTNVADAGTGAGTVTLLPCADRTYAVPSGSVARLKGSMIYQNTTTASVNVYMRSFINNSAGSLGLYGLVTAKRIN